MAVRRLGDEGGGGDNNDPNPAFDTLALNYRYMGAWNEVSTRIGLRQNAVTMYVTLSSAILTILASAPRIGLPIDIYTFSLLVPGISLFLGLLNFKHDKTIALLREFMRECERSGSAKRLNLVGYNSNPHYRKFAVKYRNLHDVSAALLILIFNGIGLFVAYNVYPSVSDITRWPIVVYVAVTFLSIYLVMHSTFKSDSFLARPVESRASEIE